MGFTKAIITDSKTADSNKAKESSVISNTKNTSSDSQYDYKTRTQVRENGTTETYYQRRTK